MSAISTLSKAEGMIVIASIHQPSLETIALFTNVMFLARGAMCYLGRVDQLDQFFEKWGRPVGRFVRYTFSLSICQIHAKFDHL